MQNSILQILVPSGDPTGLRIIQLAGWSGRAFHVSRDKLSELKNHKEASNPGIYFLYGESDSGEPTCYIGQSNKALKRVNQHLSNPKLGAWNTAVIFTDQGDIDVLYLESKCIQEAESANRYKLDNESKSPGQNLSDFRKASNDDFFNKIVFVNILLGYTLFEKLPSKASKSSVYVFEDVKNKDGIGKGTLLSNGQFLVYKGSKARVRITKSFEKHNFLKIREALIEDGKLILTKDGKSYIFNEDSVFKSPSAAAAAIMGRACNGWTAWKNAQGQSIDELIRKAQ